MAKFIWLFFILITTSINAQAKTMFVGIGGGADMFFDGNDSNSDFYVADKRFAGISPEEIAREHSGLDALSVYLKQHLGNGLLSIMFQISVDPDYLADLVHQAVTKNSVDTVYIAGYSAGGGVALRTARKLNELGVVVNALVLIDEKSSAGDTIYRNVKNLYVYYQKDDKLDIFDFLGNEKYTIKSPSKTKVSTVLIDNVDHLSIDNDPRVWKDVGDILMGNTRQPSITAPNICNSDSCPISTWQFSTGELFGWYPAGDCLAAQKWFRLNRTEGDALVPVSFTEDYYPCQCR